jgi:hypothetical protein
MPKKKKRTKKNRARRNAPKSARMMARPKGWIKAKAVKIVGNKVYIRRAKTRKAKR